MKKLIALFCCIVFCTLNVSFAAQENTLLNLLDKNLKVQKSKMPYFEDELVNSTLNKNLKANKYTYAPIYDDFAKYTLKNNLKITHYIETPIIDETAPKNIQKNTYVIGNLNQKFNFENLNRTIVKISPRKLHSTKDKIGEGEFIDFVIKEDANYKNFKIKKGDIVRGRIEHVSKNEAQGVPAHIVIDNFVILNKKGEIRALGQINEKGADRSLWVRPVSLCLLPFFFVGVLFISTSLLPL